MFKRNLLIWSTIILGSLFQFAFLFSHNFRGLLLNTLPDDAFYYFRIARNIVEGYGSTFDGINITNGYHPLWMALILPIFKLFSVGGTFDIQPIYATLTFSLILSLCTGIVLLKIFRKYTDNSYILAIGLFFWFFNPYNLYAVLNGLETSLTLFLLVSFSLSLLNAETARRKKLQTVLIGVLGGLLILARLDIIFVVFFGYLYLLYKRTSFKKLALSGLITAAIFLVWQVWNYVTYGMMLTSASITGTYVNQQLTFYDNGGKSLFLVLKTMVYMFDRAFTQLASNLGAPFVVFPLVGIALYFFAKNFGQFFTQVKQRMLSPLWFISLGLIVQMAISAMVRWSFRDWYFIPTLFVFQFIVLYACIQLAREFKNFKYAALAIIICAAGFFYISYDKDLQNREIMQDTIWEAVQWQNKNLPVGSKIGSFNAGIQGYFSKHTLVNLDGLVNNQASDHMLQHDMWKYITEVEKLDYISDFPQYFTYRYNHFFGEGLTGLDVIKKMKMPYSVTTNGNTVNLYQLR